MISFLNLLFQDGVLGILVLLSLLAPSASKEDNTTLPVPEVQYSCTEPSFMSHCLLLDHQLQQNCNVTILWYGCYTEQSRSRSNTDKPCRLLQWCNLHLPLWLLLDLSAWTIKTCSSEPQHDRPQPAVPKCMDSTNMQFRTKVSQFLRTT